MEGENGHRNYFMINFHKSYVAGLGLELMSPGSVVRHTANCATELDFISHGISRVYGKTYIKIIYKYKESGLIRSSLNKIFECKLTALL